MTKRLPAEKQREHLPGLILACYLIPLLAGAAFFKSNHITVPILNIDGGVLFFGVVIIAGLAICTIYDKKRQNTLTLITRGNYAEAEALLRKGLSGHQSVGPRSHDYLSDLLSLANILRLQGKYPDAEEFAGKALEISLGNLQDIESRPTASSNQRLRPMLESLKKKEIEFIADAYFELAAISFETGKFQEATKFVSECQLARNDLDEAQKTPRRLNDETQSNLLTRDFSMERLQRIEQAAGPIRQYHSNRKGSKIMALLQKIHEKNGEKEEALAAKAEAERYHRKCLELIDSRLSNDSRTTTDYMLRANTLISLGKLDRAADELSQALAHKPDKMQTYSIHLNRGECYNRMGKLDLALQDFDKALEVVPDSAMALLNRSEVHEKRGNKDLWLRDKQRATQLGYRFPVLDLT